MVNADYEGLQKHPVRVDTNMVDKISFWQMGCAFRERFL